MWHRVTRNPKEFHGLMGCQQDPRIWGVTTWYQSLGNDYLGGSNMGIHKYGLEASSSQLGIMSLGTRVPTAVGMNTHRNGYLLVFGIMHHQCDK